MGSQKVNFQWHTDRYVGCDVYVKKFEIKCADNSSFVPQDDLPQGLSKMFWTSKCLGEDSTTGSCSSMVFERTSPDTKLEMFKGMTWADIAAKWPKLCESGYAEELKEFCIEEGKYKTRIVRMDRHPVFRSYFDGKYRDVHEGVSSSKIRELYSEEMVEIIKIAEKLAMMKEELVTFKLDKYPDSHQEIFPLLEVLIDENDLAECSCHDDGDEKHTMDDIVQSFVDSVNA